MQMVNRRRSLSSPCIKMEVLHPQPQIPFLITPGIDSFPAAGEFLDVEEVVKNFENSPMPKNDNFVRPKTKIISPNITKSSTIFDRYDDSMTTALRSSDFGSNMDPKKIRRLVANRESAVRARQRKVEYIEKLKQDIKTQEDRVSELAPQLSKHENENVKLEKENNSLKEMLQALTTTKLRKEAEYEALKKELKELTHTFHFLPKNDH